MASHQPSRKRARLDEALHKPFRSPLKHGLNGLSHASPPRTLADTTLGNCSQTVDALPVHINNATVPVKPDQNISATSDANLHANLTIHRALEAHLRAVHLEVDVLIQADHILSSERHNELITLTSAWKGTARAAAEELFAYVKDKVNRMGGYNAWREDERQRVDRRRDWERQIREDEMKKALEDLKNDGTEEDLEDGQSAEEAEARMARIDKAWEAKQATKEMLEQMMYESSELETKSALAIAGAEHEQYQREEDMDGNHEFTMDMMLRTMHIDLDLIGYDKNEQRWND